MKNGKLNIQHSMCIYISICISIIPLLSLRESNGNKNCLYLFYVIPVIYFLRVCFIWFSNFSFQSFLTRERPFMSNLTWFVEIRRYAFLHFQKLNFNIFSGVETWTRQGLTKGDNLAIWWNNINVLILWHVSLECSPVG